METKEKIRIKRCPECGSNYVAPCYDAENGISGLYSCEKCEVMRGSNEFVVEIEKTLAEDVIFALCQKLDVVNILATALYGSCWCYGKTPKEMNEYVEEAKMLGIDTENWCREDKWAYILNQEGGYIYICDVEEDEEYKLTLEMLRKAWLTVLVKYPNVYNSIVNGQDDIIDNDTVLQVALFGVVIYA